MKYKHDLIPMHFSPEITIFSRCWVAKNHGVHSDKKLQGSKGKRFDDVEDTPTFCPRFYTKATRRVVLGLWTECGHFKSHVWWKITSGKNWTQLWHSSLVSTQKRQFLRLVIFHQTWLQLKTMPAKTISLKQLFWGICLRNNIHFAESILSLSTMLRNLNAICSYNNW